MDTYAQGIEALSLIEKEAENKATVKWSSSIIRMLKFIESKGISEVDLSSELNQLSILLNKEYKASELRIFYSKLSKKLTKEYGFVTPKYYTIIGMTIGMAAFGLPLGFMFAFALDNMAFLGIGLPIGMPIGMAIGAVKDKKAKDEGNVIEV